MFKTLEGPDGPQLSKKHVGACVMLIDDWYDFSEAHSSQKGIDQIGCERTQFIGYLCEAAHYAMHDIYDQTTSFYTICKENDDNVVGKHMLLKDDHILMNFNVFNSLDINMTYAAQRAGDFCWEVFKDIKVTQMERHLWNVEVKFDLDIISDKFDWLFKLAN